MSIKVIPARELTAREVIAGLALSRVRKDDARAMLLFLAGLVYSARLEDGQRLLDATDFKAWLEELAKALEEQNHA